jgi:TP901 family phage tail tape measure protein
MATERIEIQIVEKGSKTVKRSFDEVGSGATKAQSAVSLLRTALGTLAIGFTLSSVISTLADFSQQISTVKAITGATESEMKALTAEIRQLGATTRFSASQAAEGAQYLARAGFDTNAILESLGSTLTLAQAGALDLGTAADIASNILTGFRLNTSEASRVVDVLAYAANRSNTNVQQLGEGMKFVAPVAAGLGVSLEEVTAAIGALSDAGLQGSMAGTGLRKVLSTLEQGSSGLEKVLARANLTLRDVKPSVVGLAQAMDNLQKAGVDTGEALELFGERGGPAFEVLSTSIPRVKELTEELKNAEGFAATVAATMDDNLNGAILRVKSAFEELILTLGDLGSNFILTAIFDLAAASILLVANNLNDLVFIGYTALAMYTLLNAGAIFSTAIMYGFAAAVWVGTAAFTALNFIIAMNPFVRLATTIIAVLAIVYQFGERIGFISEALVYMRAAVDVLGQAMTFMWTLIKPYWDEWSWIIGVVWDLMVGFGKAVLTVLKALLNPIKWLVDGFIALAEAVGLTLDISMTWWTEAVERSRDIQTELQKELALRNSLKDATVEQGEAARRAAEAAAEASRRAQEAAAREAAARRETTRATDELTRSTQLYGGTAVPVFNETTSAVHGTTGAINQLSSSMGSATGSANSLASALRSVASAGSGIGGGGGFSSNFGTNSGGASGRGGGLSDMTRHMSSGGTSIYRAKDYGGFQNGGSFTVEGEAGGPDRNLVMFKATKGETVDIKTPAQRRSEADNGGGGGGGNTVVIERLELVVVGVQDPNDFRRTERQIMRDLAGAIGKAMS